MWKWHHGDLHKWPEHETHTEIFVSIKGGLGIVMTLWLTSLGDKAGDEDQEEWTQVLSTFHSSCGITSSSMPQHVWPWPCPCPTAQDNLGNSLGSHTQRAWFLPPTQEALTCRGHDFCLLSVGLIATQWAFVTKRWEICLLFWCMAGWSMAHSSAFHFLWVIPFLKQLEANNSILYGDSETPSGARQPVIDGTGGKQDLKPEG